jgi:poly-gamma-glutamate capsule biosynthesis protein CapA/YwtB (metallophosphatase superfamily)
MEKFKFSAALTLISLSILAGFFAPTLISKSELSPGAKDETIEVIIVGDIMLDRGVAYMTEKYGNGDFRFPFLKIADELNKADIVFGNLEGPISDKGERVGSIYSFRMNPKVIEGLSFAGFNVLSLANNHSFDFGRQALEDTFTRLRDAGIDYVGFGPAVIKEVNGTKIGFLAYSPFGINKISENDFTRVKEEIKTAKEQVDVLVVSLHAGEEYQKTPTRFQVDFFNMANEAGADVVAGHHPHVIQATSTGSGQVFYSLGNFVFDQGFSQETMQGEIVKVLIENGKIKEMIPVKIELNQYFQPVIE